MKGFFRMALFVMLVLVLFAASNSILAAAITFAQEKDTAEHPSCPLCGMDRVKFAHSRILTEYDDGSSFGACSIHCAAVNMALNIDKAPMNILVGDYDSKKLIDAEKAFWVLGGAKMGVMTQRAKWAFADKAGAQRFIDRNRGEQVDFETALRAAYEDMYQDTRMIRERRKLKRMQMHHSKK